MSATPHPPSKASTATTVLLWLAIGGAALGHRAIGSPGVTVADLALAACLGLWAWRAARDRRWPRPRWALWLAGFVLVAGLSGVAQWLWTSPPFSPVEFAKSFAKLALYAAAAVALGGLLADGAGPRAAEVTRDAFAIGGAAAILIYCAVLLGFELPRELACGTHPHTCSAYYYELRWAGESGPIGLVRQTFLRAQGLAYEPTRFGYLQAMALGLLLLRRPLHPPPGWRHLLIALSAAMSFALAPYAVLAVAIALFAPRVWRELDRRARLRLLAGSGLVLLLFLSPPLSGSLQHAVIARARRILSGQYDGSAFLRTAGSWIMAGRLAERRPLTGVGLGNFDVGVQAIREELPRAHLLAGSVEGWNALAYVLGTTGALGLVAFVALCVAALRRQWRLGLVFLAGMFADGSVLSPPFWVFFALFADPEPARAGG